MSLSTVHANAVLLLGDQIVFGTCMLGDDFGTVDSASVKRTADKEQIENCHGNLKALLLKNPRFELKLDTIFDSSVTAPGLYDEITLPLVGVTGRVLDVEVKWAKGKERMLSIEATHWDALVDASSYSLSSTGLYTPASGALQEDGGALLQEDGGALQWN